MAAKRFFSEPEADTDQPPEKRMRTRPSFASVIGEVVMVNSLQHFCSALEPMLRRVVNEEVERGLKRCTRSLTRTPSFRIQAPEPSNLLLKFNKTLNLPIFTGSKIVDVDNNPLRIHVAETGNDQNFSPTLPSSIKIEIVVLDGDFPPGDRTNWTSEEFDSSIVRERSGKRPLLAGDVSITMRNGNATIGDIELTDNSSWIRSRKFRLGARVVPGSCQGSRIHEAITEAFMVKDHRGELYKKHYPPSLDDEVWRLEKIGKEGAFHKKLANEGIKTVQDFLKLSVVEPGKLRGPYIENLVRLAYSSWSSLHEFEGLMNETALLTQGEMEDQYRPHGSQVTEKSMFQQCGYQSDRALFEVDYLPLQSGAQNIAANDWQMMASTTYVSTPVEHVIRYSITETSSDGDITPRSFMSGT